MNRGVGKYRLTSKTRNMQASATNLAAWALGARTWPVAGFPLTTTNFSADDDG